MKQGDLTVHRLLLKKKMPRDLIFLCLIIFQTVYLYSGCEHLNYDADEYVSFAEKKNLWIVWII